MIHASFEIVETAFEAAVYAYVGHIIVHDALRLRKLSDRAQLVLVAIWPVLASQFCAYFCFYFLKRGLTALHQRWRS